MSAAALSHMNSPRRTAALGSIPARAGIGLKARHYEEILAAGPDVAWFEIHPENYMGDGGPPHRYLGAIRERYPLSMHSVGLSLGSPEGVEPEHLARLERLIERYEPALVSDHLSWSTHDDRFFNDLLPLPYTAEALAVVARNVDRVQERLKRQILIENPSTYLTFRDAEMSEPEFLTALVRQSGCRLLLDVNNVFVSACNHGWDARVYIDAIPADLVGEIHLAGHLVEHVDGADIRVDDHGSAVCDEVWDLYARTIAKCGPVPTLIEWDANVPTLEVWRAEAAKADRIAAAAIEGARRVASR